MSENNNILHICQTIPPRETCNYSGRTVQQNQDVLTALVENFFFKSTTANMLQA